MKTSNAGRSAIRTREGCKLKAYKDTVGVWTIGVGHTGRASAPLVTPDMVITQAQADQYLANDLVPFEKVVNECGSMTQNQFDACVSLAFNIGETGFRNSTVARKLKAKDYKGAGEAILMWNKPSAIIGRRKTEYNQYFSGNEPTTVVVPVTPVVVKTPAQPPVAVQGFWSSLIQAIVNIFRKKK